MDILTIVLRILVFLLGLSIVLGVCLSAIKIFVVPRSINDRLTTIVFRVSWFIFRTALRNRREYLARDRVMALFAPITLMVLPGIWLLMVFIGYTLMFWAFQQLEWAVSFKTSGSSLFTLGFIALDDLPIALVGFTEAALGLALLGLLIAYLPTIYASFARRELVVTMLQVRAGTPPSAVNMISRFHFMGKMHVLNDYWISWENWFADLDESHTSLSMLVFFRSPQPERSWVTTAVTILDAASLYASTLKVERDPQAELCIRAGFLALRHIADYFQINYNSNPQPTDPIILSRAEYDKAYDQLLTQGIALKPDREQAWRDFAGWRVNYEDVLLSLAELTMAPDAPWLSEEARQQHGLVMGNRVQKTHPRKKSVSQPDQS